MRLLIPNFQFEDELSTPTGTPRQASLTAIEDLSCPFGLMGLPGDKLLLPTANRPTGIPDCLGDLEFVVPSALSGKHRFVDVVPWGWTRRVRDICSTLNCSVSGAPAEDCVFRVNSRGFQALFDDVISDSPDDESPGAKFGVLCSSQGEWEHAVIEMQRQGHTRWVAKPQLSHAGRNRLIAEGIRLNDQQSGWLSRHIRQGVYVEPWVELLEEWSLQYEISSGDRRESNRLIGSTRLLNDAMGRYRGNVVAIEPDQGCPKVAVEHGFRICSALEKHGYRGPLGIDLYRYTDLNGNSGIRVCNDINARHTMGRLSLNAAGLLEPFESGLWCQIRLPRSVRHKAEVESSDPSETARKVLATYSLNNVRVIRTSPLAMGGRPVRVTTLLLAGSSSELVIEAEGRIRACFENEIGIGDDD